MPRVSKSSRRSDETARAIGTLRRLARIQLICLVVIATLGSAMATILGRALVDARASEAALVDDYVALSGLATDLRAFESRFWRDREFKGLTVPAGGARSWLATRAHLSELSMRMNRRGAEIRALAKSSERDADMLLTLMLTPTGRIDSTADMKRLKSATALVESLEATMDDWVAALRRAHLSTRADANVQTQQLLVLTIGVVALIALGSIALALGFDRARGRLAALLATLADSDALTGLANRRAFERHLGRDLTRTRLAGTTMCLALLDIDHFKRLNDEHGHHAGDVVLAAVANALRASTREGDLVARIGGEEFAWILPGSTIDDATAAVERGREAIAELRLPHGVTVRVSAGVAETRASQDPDELLRRADDALYEAKRAGRDRIHVSAGAGVRPAAAPV